MLRAQAARSGCYQSPQPFHPHITLLRDAVLRRKLAEQGRATLAALTLAQMVSRVEQVYRGVCGAPPTAAAAR